MSDRRDFSRNAQQMREALDQYSREELVDLLTHLVRVYVIEGDGGGPVEASAPAGLEAMRGLTFAQLVLHLQMNLPHEGLRQLQVSGGRVWVSEGGTEITLTAPPAPEAPPDAEMIERDPPTRMSAEEAFGAGDVRRPARGEVAVAGPVAPQATAPQARREGTPRPRTQVRQGPAATAREAARVERPGLGLRAQPQASPRQPPTALATPRDWAAEMTPRRGQTSEPPAREPVEDEGDEVGEVSDRFSMLELD